MSNLSTNRQQQTEDKPPLLIGRDNEINFLFGNILNSNNNKRISILTGELGIGKSQLLDEFYRRLRNGYGEKFFVGYYDKNNASISEPESRIYPFRIVLASLILGAKESQQPDERTDNTLNRLQKTLVKFTKEEGVKMVEAIIEDAANVFRYDGFFCH